jgi:hypothetical protein
VQTVCSAVRSLQCVLPMLQTDSVCTVLILFVVVTYSGNSTSRKVAGSIPDGVTVIFQILCADLTDRWLVVSWTTTKRTITARLYRPARN